MKISIKIILSIIFPIFSLIFPLLTSNLFIIYVLTLIFLWAYLGQSWNILTYIGQISFGHAAFFGIGAYASSLLFTNYGLTPWIGMWLGGVIAVIIGFIIGFPTLKLTGVYFALATIAIAEIVRLLTLRLDFITRGSLGVILPLTKSPLFMQFPDPIGYYYVTLIMLLILSFICNRLEKSKFGIAWRMIKEDEIAALSVGIDTFKYKMIALILSAFFTALGGTIFAQITGYIRPDTVMTLERSEEILIIALLGGTGTYIGPIIGSFILIPIRQTVLAFLGGTYRGIHLVVYGILIVLVATFSPGGVYSYIKLLAEKLKFKFQGKPF